MVDCTYQMLPTGELSSLVAALKTIEEVRLACVAAYVVHAFFFLWARFALGRRRLDRHEVHKCTLHSLKFGVLARTEEVAGGGRKRGEGGGGGD